MRRSLLLRPLRLLAACGLLLAAFACSDSQRVIYEFEIEEILEEIDQAANAKDIDAMLKHLADDARITMIVHQAGGTRSETLAPRTYRRMLEQSFSLASSYRYVRTDSEIEVAADGRSAKVKSVIDESLTALGQQMNSQTVERAVFELRDDRAVVTSLVGMSRFEP